MKADIHPDYHPVVFEDASTGTRFLTRSTVTSERTVTWTDGKTYPLLVVDVTADSTPSGPARNACSIPRAGWRNSNASTANAPCGPGRNTEMAVPKRRMSPSNTRSRRSNWKATPPGPGPGHGERCRAQGAATPGPGSSARPAGSDTPVTCQGP